ncbi:MAG: hypothetical protein V1844_14135 [Pseudomonadota bacterium]
MGRKDLFFWSMSCGVIVVAYITLPLAELMVSPSLSDLKLIVMPFSLGVADSQLYF